MIALQTITNYQIPDQLPLYSRMLHVKSHFLSFPVIPVRRKKKYIVQAGLAERRAASERV